MSVSGLCQVCEAATATDRCDRCGRLACADHFDEEYGLCVDCAREVRRGRDGGGGGGGTGDGSPETGEPFDPTGEGYRQ
ncbi:MAG: hypothetical protein ABEJ42_09940 [Halobacteriaceae archaeon]